MNWGKKILFVYLLFVAGIVFMVMKAMNQNQDLVTGEYYEQELKFQQKIDETKRTDSIANAVSVRFENDSVKLSFADYFSKNKIEGSVLIFCPDDQKKDVNQDFSLPAGSDFLSVPYGSAGFRHVKVSWTCNGKKYYREQDLFINK